MALEMVLGTHGLSSRLLLMLGPVAAYRLRATKPSICNCDLPLASWHAPDTGAEVAMSLLDCTDASKLSTKGDREALLNKLFLITPFGSNFLRGHASLLDVAVQRQLRPVITLLRMRGQILHFLDNLSLEAHVQADAAYTVLLYLEAGVSPDTNCNAGRSPLMVASTFRAIRVMRVLLGQGAHVNQRSLFGGWTALMWAAHVGWEEGCRLLLSAGAETSATNTQGLTAGAIAAHRGHNSLELMLRGIDHP